MEAMMRFEEYPEELILLSDKVQEAVFLDFAKRDPEETLHFHCLFIEKPYATDVLRVAAMNHPEIAAEKILKNPDHPKFKALYGFMIEELGEAEAMKHFERAQGTLGRLGIFGILANPIRWGAKAARWIGDLGRRR